MKAHFDKVTIEMPVLDDFYPGDRPRLARLVESTPRNTEPAGHYFGWQYINLSWDVAPVGCHSPSRYGNRYCYILYYWYISFRQPGYCIV